MPNTGNQDNSQIGFFEDLDEGQKLSEHTAAFDALVYVLDGETEVAISKKSHCLKEGDMIMMPANQPHAVRAVTRFKMLLVMIKS